MALGPDTLGWITEPKPKTEARIRADGLEEKIDAWMKQQSPSVHLAYPLPWFAYEGSEVLYILIPRYEIVWRCIDVTRGPGIQFLNFYQ